MRTRARLTCTLGLIVATLTAALLTWWQPDGPPPVLDAASGDARPASTGPRDAVAAAAESRRTGEDVPVDTETDATTLTWAQPDGKLRTRISAVPQRAKNTEGLWAPIDTKVSDDAKARDADGLTVRPANVPLPVRFANGNEPAAGDPAQSPATTPGVTTARPAAYGQAAAAPAKAPAPAPAAPSGKDQGAGEDMSVSVLAEVDLAGHTVAYTWPGPLPKPVLDGPRALYPEVLPGVDLLLVARQDGGFGQVLIVKTKEAAAHPALATVTYGLRSATAVFRHDPEAQRVAVLDPGSGAEIGSVPTPFAWDSSGQDPQAAQDPQAVPRTSVGSSAEVLRLSGLAGMEPGSRQAPLPIEVEGDGTSQARLRLDVGATGLLTDPATRFPVFVDPTMHSGEQAWTTAYKPHPNSSFFNGTNFNNGTPEARVGYEKESGGTARAFWRMGFDERLKGAALTSATFRVLNNHTWSCTARTYRLYWTGPISSGTTWNKQPDWATLQDEKGFAHGRTGCADDYVGFNVKDAAQKAADAGAPDVTLGLRSVVENDTFTWRKFKADAAELTVVYNRAPDEPVDGTMNPGGACVPGTGAGQIVAKANLVLSARATDADGNLTSLRFRFWKDGDAVPAGTVVTPQSDGRASTTVPSATLVDTGSYSWDVRAEDSEGAASATFPAGDQPCRVTVDASGPPAPAVTSAVFKPATPDGATWATVRFGQTGAATFTAADAVKFSYSFAGLNIKEVPAVNGTATIPDLKPTHSGPVALLVHAYDAAGNRSQRTDYLFYLPPRQEADGPGDVGGDGRADLLAIDAEGNLRTFPGDERGEMYGSLAASYTSGGQLNPPGHWFDPATGRTALITHRTDVYPGDGTTDLFARIPDGSFWIYPGDGYGSFNVDKRIRVKVPAGVPNPDQWTQIMAVGDLTGDKLPELLLRTGTAFWALEGYTGGAFQKATLMNPDVWGPDRELLTVGDIDLDGKADLVWRSPGTGNLYLRFGKPGTAPGSTDLLSIATAGASRDKADVNYGAGWTKASIPLVISTPDVNGDRIPDLWAKGSNGYTWIYHPGAKDTGVAVQAVLGTEWSGIKAFG
ncbi:DNRLRE domain-containing protein [Streptomyces sp. NPDC051567]|uniref:DNRLRE domain-containing protein n=1 Tax=Streptomyces sp. NPDC051567 TaxID=3365660 RepID=UPI00379ECA22